MILVYSRSETHPFFLNLLRREARVFLPIPQCQLFLLHAHGHLSKSQLLERLGLSDGFYRRAEALIKMLPSLVKLFDVNCYGDLSIMRARDRAFYEVAKAAYLTIFTKTEVPPPTFPRLDPPGGSATDVVLVDNFIDYVTWRDRGEWVFLAVPRPTPVERYLLEGRLDVEEYLRTSLAAGRHG